MALHQYAPLRLPSNTTRLERSYVSVLLGIRRQKYDTGFQADFRTPYPGLNGGPFTDKNAPRIDEDRVAQLRQEYQCELDANMSDGTPVDPERLKTLGRHIAALLPPLMRQSIVTALRYARNENRGLRLALEVTPEASELLTVPWELIVLPINQGAPDDAEGEDFLLLSADVVLVRQVRYAGHNTTPVFSQPLLLQAVVATPAGESPIAPDVINATRTSIAQVLPTGAIERCWYQGLGTLQALKLRLTQARPEVVHILCHGKYAEDIGDTPRSYLHFTHADGRVERVSAYDLAHALVLAPVQLVVLQACDSGLTGVHESFSSAEQSRVVIESIALTLVRYGVPAVVAMQGVISQDATAAFVQAFYGALRDGACLERSILAGRCAMAAPDRLAEWRQLVVYQGSGQSEPEPLYARYADRLMYLLLRPSMRGISIAVALMLLVISIGRWLLWPTATRPPVSELWPPLLVWSGVWVVCPAIIATAQRLPERLDETAQQYTRHLQRAKWSGAYISYIAGSVFIFLVVVMLWLLGLLEAMPVPVRLAVLYVLLAALLFFTYAGSRFQLRGALAIMQTSPELYNWGSIALIFAVVGIMNGCLYTILYGLSLPEYSALFDPSLVALVLGLLLLAGVLFS